jgi:hypothetical protein
MNCKINSYFLSLSKLCGGEEKKVFMEKSGLLSAVAKLELVKIGKTLPDIFYATYYAVLSIRLSSLEAPLLFEASAIIMSRLCGGKELNRPKQSPRSAEVVYIDEIISEIYSDLWWRLARDGEKEFNLLFLAWSWGEIFASGANKGLRIRDKKEAVFKSYTEIITTDRPLLSLISND